MWIWAEQQNSCRAGCARNLPDHTSNSSPVQLKPKQLFCARKSKEKHNLSRVCISRTKSYMDSLRVPFTSSLQGLHLKDEVLHGFPSHHLCPVSFFHRTCRNIITRRAVPCPSPVVRTGNKFMEQGGCKTNMGTNAVLSLQPSTASYSLFSRVKKYDGNHPLTACRINAQWWKWEGSFTYPVQMWTVAPEPPAQPFYWGASVVSWFGFRVWICIFHLNVVTQK